jgi:hypothetical protein
MVSGDALVVPLQNELHSVLISSRFRHDLISNVALTRKRIPASILSLMTDARAFGLHSEFLNHQWTKLTATAGVIVAAAL